MSAHIIRGIGRPNLWLLLAMLGLLPGVILALQGYWLLTQTTVGDVESMIEENVPIGSSQEDVLSFLNDRGIEHGEVSIAGARADSLLEDAGYREGTVYIGAIMRNTSQVFFSTADIQMYFIFDENGRLKDYLVVEGWTSL